MCICLFCLIGCKDNHDTDKINLDDFVFAQKGNEYAIIGYNGKSEMITPTEYKGKPVTKIAESAFYNGNLSKAVIGESIVYIGDNAFASCYELTDVYFSKSITNIGENIFAECNSLMNIDVDKENQNFKSIDGNLYDKQGKIFYCFARGKVEEEFTLPEGVEEIKSHAFYMTSFIMHMNLPSTLNKIGELAFSATLIEDFFVAEGNSVFSSEDGVIYKDNGTTLYYFPFNHNEQIILKDDIKKIAEDALSYKENGDIVLNEGLEEIGERAFMQTQIFDINIPKTVKKIGKDAFQETYDLINIYVNDENPYYKDIDGNLYTKDGKTLVHYASGKTEKLFSVPDGVTKLDDSSFYMTSLEELILPESISTMNPYAIYSYEHIYLNKLAKKHTTNIKKTFDKKKNFVIIVPDNFSEDYKNTVNWSDYQNKIYEFSDRKD